MRVAIRVRPGASRESVGGAYGESAIVVRVSARPIGGKATEAALRAVAEAFGVRRGAVRLISGPTSNDKVVEIMGNEEELAQRVGELRRE
ncbi:MAG TPA: DUF167 domain-containing protein [Thermopolyspora sp.]|jgi:Uncharacterized conserved protein